MQMHGVTRLEKEEATIGFFDDLGNFGKDLFTGRWAGGGEHGGLIGDIKADPWVLAAPAALATGGLGLAGIGPAAGLAGLVGGGEAAGAVGGVDALAASGGAGLPFAEGAGGGASSFLADAGISASPEALGSMAADAGVGGNLGQFTGGTLNLGDLGGGTGGITNVADAAGGSSGGSVGDFFGNLGTQAMKNPFQTLGVAAAGTGLGMNLLRKPGQNANQDRMTNLGAFGTQQAGRLTEEAQQLRMYLENGTLPPAQQAAVDQAVKARKAALISNAAKSGGNTDPTQNTGLAADLANADREGLILAGDLEKQLFASGQALLSQGLSAAGLSAQMYAALASMDRTDTANLNQSIANFAAALAGGGKGVTLKMA